MPTISDWRLWPWPSRALRVVVPQAGPNPLLASTLRGAPRLLSPGFRIGRVFADTPQYGNVGAADRAETWL